MTGAGRAGSLAEFGDRRLLGDVELQEVVPAVERLRVERVDVGAVGEREPLLVRAGEVLGERRAVAAGLLVLPLAGHEDRHLDLVDERDRGERVGDLRDVVGVGADLRQQVRRPRRAAPGWPCRSGRRPGSACRPRPGRRSGRAGLASWIALLGPVDGEAGVEDAARVERRLRRVDHRQRRDRREARRVASAR